MSYAGKQTRDFTCLALSDDRDVLFAGSGSGDVVSVLMKSRVVQGVFQACGGVGGVEALCVMPGLYLLAGGADGTVTMFQCLHTQLKDMKRIVVPGSKPVTALQISPEKDIVVVGSASGKVMFLKTRPDLPIAHWTENPVAKLNHMCFPSGTIKIWRSDNATFQNMRNSLI